MLVETMKNKYVNETPPIDVFVNPKMPYIKNVYDVIDSITTQHFSLKNYNDNGDTCSIRFLSLFLCLKNRT